MDAAALEPACVELPGARPGKRGITVALVRDPSGARRLVQVSPAENVSELSVAITHPHVLSLRAVGETDEGPVLLSDYVSGITVAELLQLAASRGLPVPAAVAVRIVLDLCAGAAALHASGRKHGAISPQRATVGEDGIARLVDPRLVHRRPATPVRRRPELAYTAPEVLGGGEHSVESDVFSLGVIAWEALARQRLFRADRDLDATRRVVAEVAPRLSEVAQALGTHLDNVIAKALAKDPDARYDTVDGFAAALESLASRRRWLGEHVDVSAFVRAVASESLAARRRALEALVYAAPQPRLPSPLATVGAAAMFAAANAATPATHARADALEERGTQTGGRMIRALLQATIALTPAILVVLVWGAWLMVQPAPDRTVLDRGSTDLAEVTARNVAAAHAKRPVKKVALDTLPAAQEPIRRAAHDSPRPPAPSTASAAGRPRVAASPGETPVAETQRSRQAPAKSPVRTTADDLPSNPYGS